MVFGLCVCAMVGLVVWVALVIAFAFSDVILWCFRWFRVIVWYLTVAV